MTDLNPEIFFLAGAAAQRRWPINEETRVGLSSRNHSDHYVAVPGCLDVEQVRLYTFAHRNGDAILIGYSYSTNVLFYREKECQTTLSSE